MNNILFCLLRDKPTIWSSILFFLKMCYFRQFREYTAYTRAIYWARSWLIPYDFMITIHSTILLENKTKIRHERTIVINHFQKLKKYVHIRDMN